MPLDTDSPAERRKAEKAARQSRAESHKGDEAGRQSKEEKLPPGAITRDLPANTLRTLLGTEALRSTLFTIHRTAEGSFVVEGRGWGHGRGLCQVGAMALAAAPRSLDFRAILRRYYAGATLAPLGTTEENEEGAGRSGVCPAHRSGSTRRPRTR